MTVAACSSDEAAPATSDGGGSAGQSGQKGGTDASAGTSGGGSGGSSTGGSGTGGSGTGGSGTGGSGTGGSATGGSGTGGSATGGTGQGGALPEAGLDATADAQPADAKDDVADTSPCTVEVVFEVDATGSQLPLDSYVTLANPPPPNGTGVLHIVGNLAALGTWTPNATAMRDDGVSPDATAGDGIWTLGLTASCGAELQYKYTCGHSGDGWAGTEEYPLTNRGYTLPDGCSKVVLRDVFADRPASSGALGPLADVDTTCP